MSPYQSFSQSPPEQGRGGGGRGGKGYGQSPFLHSSSPPERGKGGKPQVLGSTPSSRYVQQSPPKPITRGKHNNSNNNLQSLMGTTPTSSSPKSRSPSGFPIRSPPSTNNYNYNSNNNNNYNNYHNNSSYNNINNNNSPRQATLYTPAQAAASISTPNIQKQNWTTPRRSNSYYNKANQPNNNQAQQASNTQQKGDNGREDGEEFMMFSPDEETSPTEPLPNTFSPPYIARNDNNNNTSSTNNNGDTTNLLDVPDTT